MTDETAKEIAQAIRDGFLDDDMEPIKCFKCGHQVFVDIAKSTIDGVVSEKQRDCNRCGQQNGYWAYGYWQA